MKPLRNERQPGHVCTPVAAQLARLLGRLSAVYSRGARSPPAARLLRPPRVCSAPPRVCTAPSRALLRPNARTHARTHGRARARQQRAGAHRPRAFERLRVCAERGETAAGTRQVGAEGPARPPQMPPGGRLGVALPRRLGAGWGLERVREWACPRAGWLSGFLVGAGPRGAAASRPGQLGLRYQAAQVTYLVGAQPHAGPCSGTGRTDAGASHRANPLRPRRRGRSVCGAPGAELCPLAAPRPAPLSWGPEAGRPTPWPERGRCLRAGLL